MHKLFTPPITMPIRPRATLQTGSLLALLVMTSHGVSAAPRGAAPIFLTPIQFKLPPVPSRGAPGQRGEGASRGECRRSGQLFTAIVPAVPAKAATSQAATSQTATAKIATDVWGLTTASHPTLFAYIPFSQKCTSLEFVMLDSANKTVYRMPVMVPSKPGLISIHSPSTAPALDTKALYHWALKATVTPPSIELSGAKSKPDVYSIDGWIQRISPGPDLIKKLQQATPQQQARLYAENGIWFDAVTTLAELRLANPAPADLSKTGGTPDDGATDWAQLLQSVKLEMFAAEPIVAR